MTDADLQDTCCENMARQLSWSCADHEDIWDCPDVVVFRSNNNPDTYGLILHDGGSSFLKIAFCPWCGAKLGSNNALPQVQQDMNFPYKRWTNDPLWPTVHDTISDLMDNADLNEQTTRDHIVGYIVMRIRSALDQTKSE